MIEKYKMYIGGESADSVSGETFESIDPYTGEAWAEFPSANAQDVDRAVRAARQAFEGPWGKTLPSERSRIMRQDRRCHQQECGTPRPHGNPGQRQAAARDVGPSQVPGELLPLFCGRGR